MTNILGLPLVSMQLTNGNNEDFVAVIEYTQADGITPMSLTGITFAMKVRKNATDAEVTFQAQSSDNSISAGGSGNGYLTIHVPLSTMQKVPADSYVGDVVGTGDGYSRVCAQFSLTVFEGVTR